MAVDTLFNDVRLLLQSGSLTNAATSSPASVGSSGVTGGATLTFASDGIITASSVSLASPTALATLELVVTPTWDEYSKIASMLGLSLNAISPGVIGIYSFATVTPTLVGSLNTVQSGEITLIAEYLVSGGSTEVKLTAIPLTGSTTTTTVSTTSALDIVPATLVLGGPPIIPVPVPGGSTTVARVQAPRAQYSQQQIASLRNTNPSNSIIYDPTPVSVTAAATGVSYTYTVTNPAGRTVDDVLSELALGISQLNGAVLMAETGYFTGAEARASLRLTFTPISSDVDNWDYSFVGMPYATAIYFLTGVYGANPPLPQISTATYTFTPGAQSSVSLTAYGITTTGLTTDMPAFVADVSSALSSLATVSGIYPFAGQCIIYVTGAIGVEFVMSSTLVADVTVPSGIVILRGARVTAKRRYIDLGAAVEYPTLPWPATGIPGGGGGGWGTLPADVIFAVNAESSGNDVAQFGLSATASGTATIQASGSRTSDGYLRNTDSAQGADACFGYTPSAGFKSAWGAAQSMTLEFDIRVDTGAFLGGQILGIGSGYSSLSDNGPSGIAITGSPFAVAVGSATLTPGAWHHIAFVADYNAGDRLIRTYRDGVQQDTPQSVLAFWFNDYPTPATIGLLQYQIGFIGNGALKGGMDNVVLTTRAKYDADFTPGMTFAEIVGYTPPPSNVDVTAAGYNDIDDITGAGTFNTQLTAPDAYFFSQVTLDDAVSTGDAYTLDGNSINFTGSRTLGATTCTGTFVYGTPQNFDSDVTLDDNTAVSTFYADTPKEWTGESTLDNVTSFGLMMFLAPATFTGESVADDAYGITSGFEATTPPSANATAVLPAVTAAARTGHKAAAVMPTPFVTSSATTRSPAGSVLTLPSLTAVIRGGHRGAATLPALIVSAQVTTTQMLRAQVTLPALTVVSTARVSGQGAVQGFVPALSATAQGGHQARAQLPGLSATAHAVSGVTARVQGVLPKITAYATGYREDTMRAAVTLPALVMTPSGTASITLPQMTAVSTGQPVVTAAHEAYVVNMNQPLDDNPRNNFESKNEQVTRYTNWPFFQVVRLGNAYYGVSEDGLYELGGATDNGTAIAWNFETCKTDFKDPHRKAVASAYIGGQAGPELTYTLRSGDDTDRMYDYITTKTVQKRNHRQKFGLGRRVRYYSFGLAGDGTAAIDSIEFELLTTTRRV